MDGWIDGWIHTQIQFFCNQYYDASLIYTLVKHVPINGGVKNY